MSLNVKPIKIYKSISDVDLNFVTSFSPVFIEKPKIPNDIFQKQFGNVEPKKRNFIHKFANLEEFYKLLYNVSDLKVLESFPFNKLKSLYLIARSKDNLGQLRFSANELLQISTLPDDKIKFIKPFARQKKVGGTFNYSFEQLQEIANFTSKEKQNAMQILEYNLPSTNLIMLCKDTNANISALKKRLDVINKIFSGNIYQIDVTKNHNDYILFLTTAKDHKSHKFIFDKNFNLNKSYKSCIDFEKGKLTQNRFFDKLKFFKKKQLSKPENLSTNLRVSQEEHFYTLDKIQEKIETLKQTKSKAYKNNYFVMQTGQGNFIKTDYFLPENMLVDYWKKGAISNEDLIKICTENAGMIPEKDLEFFALNKIKITNHDNEKYLEIRKNNYSSNPVKIGSEYYNKVLTETIKAEEEKLSKIKTEKKMIIIDGLPGAGKTTIIKKILGNDPNKYYTPDADDIKGMFKEVYKNGEGAALVHKASSTILRNEILPKVFNQGKNIIFQTAGESVKIHKIIQEAKNKGYTIDYIHIATPINLSIERSISRFEHTGRFIDPYVVLSTHNTNNKEKEFAAKIFSFHKNIRNSYKVENGQITLIKEGFSDASRKV